MKIGRMPTPPPTYFAHPLALTDEARFRTMADSAPVLLWLAGLDAECQFFNQTWLAFTGRTLERELGVGWAEGVHPEDLQHCMDIYLTSFVTRREFRMEYRLRRHDGEYRWLLDHGRPWYDESGAFAGFIGSCIDVTDMKEAHAALVTTNTDLRDMLREKDALVSEVHHRVKNNLQLVSSLLSWNERRTSDAAVRTFSEDLRRRIFSIALIHERLYRSNDFARIDLGGYTRELCQHLATAHGSAKVAMSCEADTVDVALDIAVPFGLVLTELVANAFKHAFPGGREGEIAVRLENEPTSAVLVVSDDGVGLHPDAFTSPGFGFDLVRTLASQLGARLDLEGRRSAGAGADVGTRVVMRFDPGVFP